MLVAVGITIATILSTSVFALPKLLIAGGIIIHRDIQESIESKMMKEQKKAMRALDASMVVHGAGMSDKRSSEPSSNPTSAPTSAPGRSAGGSLISRSNDYEGGVEDA
ncbi:hypothetical protein HDV00_010316 [Rhizophlyctis rosea]|nr:hypothetical protein HDV00_010316 [Rhizophlyctis rosea]